MEIVIDSHALFWYTCEEARLKKRLSPNALAALDQALRIHVPTIALLEVYYVFRKAQQEEKFSIFLERIKNDQRFVPVPLDLVAVEETLTISIDEMHDRVIVGTAQLLGLALVSRDETIQQAYPATVW